MSKEQMIHEAAMELMREAGVAVHNDKAIEILEAHGIRVEDQRAYFEEEQVMEWVKKAPEEFKLYARNSKYDMIIGGEHVNPAPVYGCAFIDEWDGTRRTGTLEDYMKCLKLVYASENYDIDGGIMIQPAEVNPEQSAAAMFYATVTHSDKVIMLATGYRTEMEKVMEAAAEVFGGKEALIEKPRMIALINTVSPLELDERMLDNLMVLAEHGQPVILCPAAMLGATGSITMAGTLAMGVAESLAGIVLAEMIRPGTPAVLGVQSTAADMQGLTFACAAPEGAKMQGYGRTLGKFYGLPCRGGGSQTDATAINAQAGYESMLTFYSAYSHGVNLIMEAGGVMNSVNATSFEKMVVDFEIIRQVKRACAPLEVNEETLNVEEIKEVVEEGGSFLTMDSTLDNYDILYNPYIGSRNAKLDHPEYFKESIDEEIERLLDEYDDNKPELDPEVQAKVRAIIEETGLDPAILDKIESL